MLNENIMKSIYLSGPIMDEHKGTVEKDSSPWMIRYCTKLLPSLEEACQYLIKHFAEIE